MKIEQRRPLSGPPPIVLRLRPSISRILFPPRANSRQVRSFLWDAHCCCASSDLPADRLAPRRSKGRHFRRGTTPVRIFGLAAGGVCHAVDVTTNAVRSYRTISPLLGDCRFLICDLRLKEKAIRCLFQSQIQNRKSAIPKRYLSVALSVGLRRLAVSKHRVLCSSDFPHPDQTAPGRDRRDCRNLHCKYSYGGGRWGASIV